MVGETEARAAALETSRAEEQRKNSSLQADLTELADQCDAKVCLRAPIQISSAKAKCRRLLCTVAAVSMRHATWLETHIEAAASRACAGSTYCRAGGGSSRCLSTTGCYRSDGGCRRSPGKGLGRGQQLKYASLVSSTTFEQCQLHVTTRQRKIGALKHLTNLCETGPFARHKHVTHCRLVRHWWKS